MNHNMVRIQASLLTCLMFGLNAPSFALPEDSQAVLEMHAGSADINQETHRGIFIGNVELDQGTTHIRAVKAITESNAKNQLTKAIIRGDTEHQAHYSVLVALDKPLLHAYADTIYYYPGKHTIKLIGHAHVEQGNNSFSAPIICYDTLHQHVTSEQKDNERTLIIFHPDRPSKISHTSEKNTSPTLQASSPPVLENGSKEDVL